SNGALLSWQPSSSPEVESQVVYRGEAAQPWLVHYEVAGRVAKSETSWHDGGIEPGKVYCYWVRSVTGHRQGSGDSTRDLQHEAAGAGESRILSVDAGGRALVLEPADGRRCGRLSHRASQRGGVQR